MRPPATAGPTGTSARRAGRSPSTSCASKSGPSSPDTSYRRCLWPSPRHSLPRRSPERRGFFSPETQSSPGSEPVSGYSATGAETARRSGCLSPRRIGSRRMALAPPSGALGSGQRRESMDILVIGASRGIGLEAVRQALERGHQVRAFARSAQSIAIESERLEKRTGDATRPDDVKAALEGVDAVIFALGVPKKLSTLMRPIHLFSEATDVLIAAMQETGV